MSAQTLKARSPKGLAFDIPDLVMLLAWAGRHAIQMAIELDHCFGDEDYEEVLVFHAQRGVQRTWIMWRTESKVVMQPLIGKPRLFQSVGEAMEVLSLERR
jgi:hypothetical protein